MILETKSLLLREMNPDDYPTLYSYCKYTNVPSVKTAESIGMHFVCEYPDETNGTTHVSSISRKEWLDEITENTVC